MSGLSPPISRGGAGTLSGTVSFPWKQCQDSAEGVQQVPLRTNRLAGRRGGVHRMASAQTDPTVV